MTLQNAPKSHMYICPRLYIYVFIKKYRNFYWDNIVELN